jgi:hypothetical protein
MADEARDVPTTMSRMGATAGGRLTPRCRLRGPLPARRVRLLSQTPDRPAVRGQVGPAALAEATGTWPSWTMCAARRGGSSCPYNAWTSPAAVQIDALAECVAPVLVDAGVQTIAETDPPSADLDEGGLRTGSEVPDLVPAEVNRAIGDRGAHVGHGEDSDPASAVDAHRRTDQRGRCCR